MSSHHHSRKRRALCRLLSLILPNRIARHNFPGTPPILIDGPSGSSEHHLDTSNVPHIHHVSSGDKCQVTIDILPDDILLHIFLFNQLTYIEDVYRPTDVEDVDRLRRLLWRWDWLAHVCRRWRSVVFASPNFLDLKLVVLAWIPVKLADIWPPLPIVMTNRLSRNGHHELPPNYDFDAIVHHSRLYEIDLSLPGSEMQRLASTMQEQFPALRCLRLSGSGYRETPAFPDGFLGGSMPGLQSLKLCSILFPALPKLLLSTVDLIHLDLSEIPHSGYISPEAIVTGLAVMANLKSLVIGFNSPLSRPDRPPPSTQTVLPALTRFEFTGVSEYLEDLVVQIDAPLLDDLSITFFHQLTFDIPHVSQFMRRMTRFQALSEAGVELGFSSVRVEYLPPTTATRRFHVPKSGLRILCTQPDWQLSSLAQVLTSFFPSTLMVEHLYIYWAPMSFMPRWIDDIEDVQWLEIFRPFTALRNLYAIKGLAQSIAAALQDLVRRRVTDVLSALENIFLEGLEPLGPIQEAFEEFVAARQLLGQRITVSFWERKREVTATDEKKSLVSYFNPDPRGWTPLEFRSMFEVATRAVKKLTTGTAEDDWECI